VLKEEPDPKVVLALKEILALKELPEPKDQ
jgi:hypothetical protein